MIDNTERSHIQSFVTFITHQHHYIRSSHGLTSISQYHNISHPYEHTSVPTVVTGFAGFPNIFFSFSQLNLVKMSIARTCIIDLRSFKFQISGQNDG